VHSLLKESKPKQTQTNPISNPTTVFLLITQGIAKAPSFLACLCDSRRKTRQQAKARRGLVGKCNSKQITQNVIDKFILQRGNDVKRPTLNKNIRNLKAFINWCRENRYVNGEIKIRQLKEDERPVKSLNSIQIRKLLTASQRPFNKEKPLRYSVQTVLMNFIAKKSCLRYSIYMTKYVYNGKMQNLPNKSRPCAPYE